MFNLVMINIVQLSGDENGFAQDARSLDTLADFLLVSDVKTKCSVPTYLYRDRGLVLET